MVITGPRTRLRASAVQAVALAIQELVTSARKHGALSASHGRLVASWSTYERDNKPHLFFERCENGNTSAPEPGSVSTWCGRTLIEQALPYSVGAKTSFELTATQLRCTVDLPLKGDVE